MIESAHSRLYASWIEFTTGKAAEVTFKIRKASTEDAAEAIIEVFDHVPFLKDLDGRVASVMIVPGVSATRFCAGPNS